MIQKGKLKRDNLLLCVVQMLFMFAYFKRELCVGGDNLNVLERGGKLKGQGRESHWITHRETKQMTRSQKMGM